MYDVGDIVPLGITTLNAAGEPAEAGTVALTIGLPDLTTVTPAVAHVAGTAVYTVDFPATMEGLHTVKWNVTGANASGEPDVFNVREITDQIISREQAKTQLGLTTDVHDAAVRLFIAASAVAIEDHIGRKIIRRTVTEKHYGVCGSLILNRCPVLSLTSLATVDGNTTFNVADLDLDGDVGIVRTLTGTALRGNLQAVYVPGMRVVPANFQLASRIIVEHLWQTMRPFSNSAATLTPGALEDSLEGRAGGLVGFAIPNRALELLGKPPPLVA